MISIFDHSIFRKIRTEKRRHTTWMNSIDCQLTLICLSFPTNYGENSENQQLNEKSRVKNQTCDPQQKAEDEASNSKKTHFQAHSELLCFER